MLAVRPRGRADLRHDPVVDDAVQPSLALGGAPFQFRGQDVTGEVVQDQPARTAGDVGLAGQPVPHLRRGGANRVREQVLGRRPRHRAGRQPDRVRLAGNLAHDALEQRGHQVGGVGQFSRERALGRGVGEQGQGQGMSPRQRQHTGVPFGGHPGTDAGTPCSRPRSGTPAGTPRRVPATRADAARRDPARPGRRVPPPRQREGREAVPGASTHRPPSAARSGRRGEPERAGRRTAPSGRAARGPGRRAPRPGRDRPPGRRSAPPAGPPPVRAPGTGRAASTCRCRRRRGPGTPGATTGRPRRRRKPPAPRSRPTNVRLPAASSTSPSRIVATHQARPSSDRTARDWHRIAPRRRAEPPGAGLQAGGSEATVVAMPARCTRRSSSERR